MHVREIREVRAWKKDSTKYKKSRHLSGHVTTAKEINEDEGQQVPYLAQNKTTTLPIIFYIFLLWGKRIRIHIA